MRRWGLLVSAIAATSAVAMGMPPAGALPGNTLLDGAAGYLLSDAGSTPSTHFTFVVPAVTCPATPQSGMYIGAYLSGGSAPLAAQVLVQCSNVSGATYLGVMTAGGIALDTGFTPQPGDVIEAILSETASFNTTELKDLTQKQSGMLKALPSPDSILLDGLYEVNNPNELPVPRFRKLSMYHAVMNGKTPAAAGAGAIDWFTSGTVRVTTGPLNKAGNRWVEKFLSSS